MWGKEEYVELHVHMYHEPVGTRVTRVYECAKWIRLGGPPNEGRSGKSLSGWKRLVHVSVGRFRPQPGERSPDLTIDRFSAVLNLVYMELLD